MSERLTVEEILVADLDMHILLKLAKFLNRDIHVLIVPFWIFTTVHTNIRAPFLALTNADPHEGILLVHKASTINFEMGALEDKS